MDESTTGTTAIASFANIPLQTVRSVALGERQQITGGVNFGAAGVKVYRLEIASPTVTSVVVAEKNISPTITSYDASRAIKRPTAQEADKPPMQDFGLYIVPNPAQDNATVRFLLSERGAVTLSIKNLLGKIMMQPLVEEERREGAYDVPLSLGNLPSGTYYCTIEQNGRRQTTMIQIVR
jgi:hypothetical protein